MASSAPNIIGVPSGTGIVGVGVADATNNILDHWIFAKAIPNWISWLMMFSAGAAVLMIIAGGAMVMIGGAEEEWRSKGMQTVTFAVLGMIIATLSYTAVEVINHISIAGHNPNVSVLKSTTGVVRDLVQGDLRKELIPGIIQIALKLVATLNVILLVYGGSLLVLRNDEDDATEKARKIILWGVIGLIIIAVAYAVVEGVANFTFTNTQ
ncbi:MAG: hypothetical protein WCJ84_06585 [Candidatus Peregrinibacteria bacterium]